MENLLNLPKALEHIEFQAPWFPPGCHSNSCEPLIESHRETLKRIVIKDSERINGKVSFLEFPKLETLHLSTGAFDVSPEIASSSFLAPKLRTFIWDYSMDNQYQDWGTFGQTEKHWIAEFGQLAVARESALNEIKIIFTPYLPISREHLGNGLCPWYLMEEAAEILRPLGISLSYVKCWSREECLQNIEKDEEEERLEKIRMDGNRNIMQMTDDGGF